MCPNDIVVECVRSTPLQTPIVRVSTTGYNKVEKGLQGMDQSSRILLVERDDASSRTTVALLREAGYQFDCAARVDNVAKMIAATSYDLLVLDIGESDNTGQQLVHEVKQLTGSLPIILVTDYPTVETAVAALHLAVVAYLIKPLDLEQLRGHVQRSVARTRMHRAVTNLKTRSALWNDTVEKLQSLLEDPLEGSVAELAGPLLATTFEGLVASVSGLRRVLDCFVATNRTAPRSDVIELLSKLDLTRTALREAVGILEETKHAFKSKRLGELRRQLQALLGVLEQG